MKEQSIMATAVGWFRRWLRPCSPGRPLSPVRREVMECVSIGPTLKSAPYFLDSAAAFRHDAGAFGTIGG